MGVYESNLKCQHCGCPLMFLSVNMSYFCPNATCPSKAKAEPADPKRDEGRDDLRARLETLTHEMRSTLFNGAPLYSGATLLRTKAEGCDVARWADKLSAVLLALPTTTPLELPKWACSVCGAVYNTPRSACVNSTVRDGRVDTCDGAVLSLELPTGTQEDHETPSCGNVFEDLGFPRDEAERLLKASDARIIAELTAQVADLTAERDAQERAKDAACDHLFKTIQHEGELQRDLDNALRMMAIARDENRWLDAYGRSEAALAAMRTEIDALAASWQPIETAPKVHPLNGGDMLLLAWVAPGIGEWIIVVGSWRGDDWFAGGHRAYPTHWKHVFPPDVNE